MERLSRKETVASFCRIKDLTGIFREIEYSGNELSVKATSNAKYRVGTGVKHFCSSVGPESSVVSSELFQLAERGKQSPLHGFRIRALFCQISAETSMMDVAAVRPLFGVFAIGIVIKLADLISAVKHRQTALRQHHGMQHQITAQG